MTLPEAFLVQFELAAQRAGELPPEKLGEVHLKI